jgi:hypothetical protein
MDTQKILNVPLYTGPWDALLRRDGGFRLLLTSGSSELDQEARNTPFCPSQEKFHTVVLRGVRNISDAF